jgi:hypothetical protein
MNTTIPQHMKILLTRLGVISTPVFATGEKSQDKIPDQSLVLHRDLSKRVNIHPFKYRCVMKAAIHAVKSK